MAEISSLSVTDASNIARWPEGMAPSGINDAGRADEGMLARWYQDVGGGITAGGTANALTIASLRTTAAAAVNELILFKAAAANTAATTVNITPSGGSARGTVAIQVDGAACVGGEMVAGKIYAIAYDGTQYQLLNPSGSPLARAVNSQSAAYTTVFADLRKFLLHPTADNNPRTFTIDSNANVPYPVGTELVFVNQINTLTIAITSDTLTLEPDNTAGSTTIAAGSEGRALKVSATAWVIRKTVTAVSTMAALTDIAAQTASQIPNVDNAIDLGSSSKKWRQIYTTGLTFTHEALTDYDEGTWTPAWSPAGGSITSYTTQAGKYVRIGNWVNCTFEITVNVVSTPSGSLTLTGLPFTVFNANGNRFSFVPVVAGWAATLTLTPIGFPIINSTTVTVNKFNGTGSHVAMGGDLANAADTYGSFGFSIV